MTKDLPNASDISKVCSELSISTSFADIFRQNSLKNGFLPTH